MRVCHVTTFWPNRLGHTHYTDALIQGMRATRPEQHFVAGEGNTSAAETEAYRCVPCFDRSADYVDDVVGTVTELGADVALIQYSPDLFGNDNRLVRLVQTLTERGVRPVVLSHSIYPPDQRTGYKPGKTSAALDRALAEHAAAMVVHSKRMRADLLARGVPADKVVVIPHGSLQRPVEDIAASRAKLGIPADAKVVLFFGFIWLGKGLDFLLSAFAKTARQVPDAYLYIGGYTRANYLYCKAYMGYLRARLRLLGIRDRAGLWGEYVPDDMVTTIYSAADVVAMPYRQDYSSVSGVVHQTAGMGKLMLCSRIAKFDEVGESISPELLVDAKDLDGWSAKLTRLLSDPEWAEQMRARVVAFAEQTSWENVGKMHIDLYETLLAGRPAASAPFAREPERRQRRC